MKRFSRVPEYYQYNSTEETPAFRRNPPLFRGRWKQGGVSSVGAEGAEQCFTKGIRPPKAAGEVPTEETPPLVSGQMETRGGGFFCGIVLIGFSIII